jgi:hypothetical protein
LVRIAAVLFLLSAATTAEAQSILDLSGTDQFHRAYFEANTKEVTFDSFQQFNWEAKARAALPWLNLDRPTPAQIARLKPFESAGPQFRTVDFRAPLDATANRDTYIVIHIGGVTPIRPLRIKGTVSFDFDATMTTVQRREASGAIVGSPGAPVSSAAFAIVGKPSDFHNVHPGARFALSNQSAAPVYEFTDGARVIAWTASEKERPEPVSALSFDLASQRWLLVKWNHDFCGSAYTLFSVNATLKPIAGNYYDCDP